MSGVIILVIILIEGLAQPDVHINLISKLLLRRSPDGALICREIASF